MKKYISLNDLIKIILIILFLSAIQYHPYSFYIFLRWIVLLGSIFLIYKNMKTGDKLGLIIFISLALIYNPIFPITMKKESWTLINIASLVATLISIIINKKIS